MKSATDLLDEFHRHVTEIGNHLGAFAGIFEPGGNPPAAS